MSHRGVVQCVRLPPGNSSQTRGPILVIYVSVISPLRSGPILVDVCSADNFSLANPTPIALLLNPSLTILPIC